MKYIGLSLGGCLRSIMAGEVSEEDVMMLITRTDCPSYEQFMAVVKAYHYQGNAFASHPDRYELGDYPIEDVLALASRLYESGRVHQPRTFKGQSISYRHPAGYGDGVWMQVVPTNTNDNPAVVEAYEKYKMLDNLTRE